MPPLLVATDLDSCLLDEAYRHDAAEPALAALRTARSPLVLASSKTRAEMEPLWRALGLADPFIVENGGAVVFPADPGDPRARLEASLHVLPLGVPRASLVEALRRLALETGAQPVGFSSLAMERIAELTGLPPASAVRAADRHFDEPFLCDDPEAVRRLGEAAARQGLRVARGGRFLHLSGPVDKGEALGELFAILERQGRRHSSVGLGDAPNDIGLLRAVDRPIVVPRPDGSPHPVLREQLPRAERAPAPGPDGWNAAVLAVLAGRALPRVAA
jgi:mannosyl-3-phosphoglycerate phosphatase